MNEFMKSIDHGKSVIDLTHLGGCAHEYFPTEFHLKRDGTKDGRESLVFVMESNLFNPVFRQMSLKTLAECLIEVGFAVVPLDKLENKSINYLNQ